MERRIKNSVATYRTKFTSTIASLHFGEESIIPSVLFSNLIENKIDKKPYKEANPLPTVTTYVSKTLEQERLFTKGFCCIQGILFSGNDWLWFCVLFVCMCGI